MLWKCCTQYTSKFGKLSSGHRTGKVSFHFNPKERQCQRIALPCNCTHLTCYQSNAQILKAKLQQYVKHELPDIQAGFRKGRGPRDQIANICWIIEKAREFQKKHLFLIYWLCQRLCVDHNKLCKILKEMGIPDHLTCPLRNLHAGQEATFRTGVGTQTGSK